MDYTKIIGWGLLIFGVLIIAWTLLYAYNVFTGKTAAPEIFEAPKETKTGKTADTQDIQAQIEKMMGEQLKGILPVDSLPKLLNLTVSSMLAFILIFGGTQISSLGIKLIKK